MAASSSPAMTEQCDPSPERYKLLNDFSTRYNCNSKNKTVSIIAFINAHKSACTEEDLIRLFDSHNEEGYKSCPYKCDIPCNGTIIDWGRNMHELSLAKAPHYKLTVDECTWFMRDLFTTKSLMGRRMEVEVLDIVRGLVDNMENVSGVYVRPATEYEDLTFSVDIVVSRREHEQRDAHSGDQRKETIICGIQVKPSSYSRTRYNVRSVNITNNDRFVEQSPSKPNITKRRVFYVYYDSRRENIVKLKEFLTKVSTCIMAAQLKYKRDAGEDRNTRAQQRRKIDTEGTTVVVVKIDGKEVGQHLVDNELLKVTKGVPT